MLKKLLRLFLRQGRRTPALVWEDGIINGYIGQIAAACDRVRIGVVEMPDGWRWMLEVNGRVRETRLVAV